jgi:hypothetical protein
MSKTVMIVEDNELNMKLLHDLLEAPLRWEATRSASVRAVAKPICRSRSRCPSSSRPSAAFSGSARVCQPFAAVAKRKGGDAS